MTNFLCNDCIYTRMYCHHVGLIHPRLGKSDRSSTSFKCIKHELTRTKSVACHFVLCFVMVLAVARTANIGPILSIIPDTGDICFVSSTGYPSPFFFIHLHAFSELPLLARRPIFCRKTVQITSPLRLIPARYYDISPVCLLSKPSSLNGVFLDVVGSHPNLPKMSVVPWP